MVRTDEELDETLSFIKEHPGVIIFTITDFEQRGRVREFANSLGIPAISPIADTVISISKHYELEPSVDAPGAHLKLDDEYFRQIDAVQYTQQHDDGSNLATIGAADILLVGVSRSSKSPTSFYLAHRGFKVANIPVYYKVDFPIDLAKLNSNTLVVGLTVHPEVLSAVRVKRMEEAAPDYRKSHNEYVKYEEICEEVKQALRFFTKHQIPYIDVTKKAVEETVAEIIKLYNERSA